MIAATLDTKAEEIDFVRRELAARGLETILIDCGVLGEPGLKATIDRDAIARAGGDHIEALRAARNREAAIQTMIRGVEVTIRELHEQGRISGYLGVGGGTNAAIAAAAFRILPFAVPKMLVSTVASGNTRSFIGPRDVVLLHSVVDIMGLNPILRSVLRQAAAMMDALVRLPPQMPSQGNGKDVVGLTAFGSTTAGANRALHLLNDAKFETLVFHARGVGGQAMEQLVDEGHIQAVLDLTITEIADEIVGGTLSAGPERLDAALRLGIANVILPGAIDMVNFGTPSTVPERFKGRQFLAHTPHATLMRTSPEENAAIAAFVARKLNTAPERVEVVIPTAGFSAYDIEGGPFHDRKSDAAFIDTLRAQLSSDIPVRVIDAHINDAKCIGAATEALFRLMHHSH